LPPIPFYRLGRLRGQPPAAGHHDHGHHDHGHHDHGHHDHGHHDHGEDFNALTRLGTLLEGGHSHDADPEYIFSSPEQRARLLHEDALVKVEGNLLNPFGPNIGEPKTAASYFVPRNYKMYADHVLHGRFDRSNRVAFLDAHSAAKHKVMLDGADELAQMLVASGVPDKVAAIISAIFIFPPCMGPTRDGYDAILGEFQEARADLRQIREQTIESWADLQHALQQLLVIDSSRDEILGLMGQRQAQAPGLRQAVRRFFDAVAAAQRPAPNAGLDPALVAQQVVAQLRSAPGRLRSQLMPAFNRIARRGPGDERVFEECVLAVMRVKNLADERTAQRMKAITSGLGVMGIGCMWWAMAFLEGAAISQIVHQPGLHALLDVMGEVTITAGQVPMVGYGLLSFVDGIGDERKLRQYRQLIADNESLLGRECADFLRAEVDQLRALNAGGKLVSGPVLAAGQLCMILGGPVLGLGLPLLLAGVSGTALGIAGRITSDMIRGKRFGYDPDALDEAALAETAAHVDGESPSYRCGQDIARMLGLLRDARRLTVKQLAWIKVLKRFYRERALHPGQPLVARIQQVQSARYYTRAYQKDLNDAVTEVLGALNRRCGIFELLDATSLAPLYAVAVSVHGLFMDPECDAMAVVNHRLWSFVTGMSLGGQHMALRQLLADLDVERYANKRVVYFGLLRGNPDYAKQFMDTETIARKRSWKPPLSPWELKWPWPKRKTAYMYRPERLTPRLDHLERDPAAQQMARDTEEAIACAIFGPLKFKVRSLKIASDVAILQLLRRKTFLELARGDLVLRNAA
jgi:hypothetical protein